MRWFTDAASDVDDANWDRRVSAYSEHLANIAPRLPRVIRALATDPALDLHDGRFELVDVDLEAGRVTMLIGAGILDVGYRQLSLRFDEATVVPENLHLLAEAIGASFRPNHWRRGRGVTEIRYHEVDLLPDGRFVLRLRLWPFHEFAVEFGAFSYSEVPLPARPAARPGRFVIHPAMT